MVSGVSGVSVSSVADLIENTTPKEFGTRNDCILALARGLKFDLGMRDASLDELRSIARQWWEQALPNIRTTDFDDTWADFNHAFDNARFPLSVDLASVAFERARADHSTPVPSWVGSSEMALLIRACRELQRFKGYRADGTPLPFSLSCSQVASHLWHTTESGTRWKAIRWLRLLCRERILNLAKRGKPGPPGSPASRYVCTYDGVLAT